MAKGNGRKLIWLELKIADSKQMPSDSQWSRLRKRCKENRKEVVLECALGKQEMSGRGPWD